MEKLTNIARSVTTTGSKDRLLFILVLIILLGSEQIVDGIFWLFFQSPV